VSTSDAVCCLLGVPVVQTPGAYLLHLVSGKSGQLQIPPLVALYLFGTLIFAALYWIGYGRLHSATIDADAVHVSYDVLRCGEHTCMHHDH
jgi:hypothetical protein